MEYEKVKEQFGNWAPLMKNIIESEAFNSLYRMLKEQVGQKKTIIPSSKNVWKSWALSDRHKVKAVVVGQDPYPSVSAKDGVMVADGIPFNCSNTKMLQPSLFSIWEAVELYYNKEGIDPDMWQSHDISWWITEENVLLINSSNTTEKDKPGIHWPYWEPIMKMFMEVLNANYRGLPIVLLGTQAAKLEASINPLVHHIYKCEHPVMGSRNNRRWQTDMFQWVNNIIEANNGPQEKIQWVRKKQVEPPKKSNIEPWIQDRVKPVPDNLDLPW